jgi:hypothetical protein
MIAQGNALGFGENMTQALNGRNSLYHKKLCRPYRACSWKNLGTPYRLFCKFGWWHVSQDPSPEKSGDTIQIVL